MKEKIELVKELITIAEQNELAELNVNFKGLKVEIKKQVPPAPHLPFMPQMAALAPSVQASSAPVTTEPDAAEPRKVEKSGIPIKTPLSGVFYTSPKPGAPPFVKVGDVVQEGQTLCIIEAMKLMNEIAAEQKGRITEICKQNGEVANEGEILFYFEPVS